MNFLLNNYALNLKNGSNSFLEQYQVDLCEL